LAQLQHTASGSSSRELWQSAQLQHSLVL